MATMKEIALGITSILPLRETPDPLFIDLWNESAGEAAALVRAVLAECHDGNIKLKAVRVPTDVWAELSADAWSIIRPLETRLEQSETLSGRLEFWRKEPVG